jgi:hypothetical protein
MALGDKPKVDQTVTPKTAPKIAQLKANANANAGGANGTAGAGFNNMVKTGVGNVLQLGGVSPEVLNQPVSTTLKNTFNNLTTRAGGGLVGAIGTGLSNTANAAMGQSANFVNAVGEGAKNVFMGHESTPTPIPGVQREGSSFSQSPSLAGNVSTLTPSQQSLDAQQNTITPSFGISGMNKNTPALGDTRSSISIDNGVKTLSAGGGTISSSSPNFGNSSPQRLADLDRTLANDKNPDVIAHRLASSQMADQRYNDAYRGGLSAKEFDNPLGSNQIFKRMNDAKAAGDISGFTSNRDLLKEQLGNETTRAGQNVSAENAKIANQSASAKLGYDAIKDQNTLNQARELKQDDQRIAAQAHNDTVTQNFANWSADSTKGGGASPNTKLATAAQLGIITDDATIIGTDNTKRLSEESDPSAKMSLLNEIFNGDQDSINLWIRTHQSKR